MIVALDDVFVVPVPTTMKAIGFFQAADQFLDRVGRARRRRAQARRCADAAGTRSRSARGRPGLALKAASEQNAINEALGNCVKRDSDCHVIAIGPFAVGPN